MQYSQEFKDNLVARILSKELSVAEAIRRYSVGHGTIHTWLRKARMQASGGVMTSKEDRPMTSLKLPKGVAYLQAYRAVAAREFLDEADFGQFCRKNGYLASSVEEWARWFKTHPDAVDKKEHDAQCAAMAGLKRKNALQAREISKKNKALTDAATMLMLSKKAEAIWGVKES